MKNWFETWFDSPYYPILYKNRSADEAELFINQLLNVLDLKAGSKIIDVGCGRGRHSIYLAQKGFEVCGIDLSSQSIADAQKSAHKHLEFHIHDMRDLFRTNSFDCAVNLFTSFGYFEKESENMAAIQNMAKSLKNNGVFVMDYLNTEKTIRNLQAEAEIEIQNITFQIKKYIQNGFIIKEIRFRDQNKDFIFTEKVGILNIEHFKNYFSQAGLKIVNLYGNYQLKSFDPMESERLIMIAVKA